MSQKIMFEQSIFYLTHTIVGISRVIAFEYRLVLYERYCQNQIFEGIHFEIQIGGSKSVRLKWKHWLLFSGMSELSKNIFGYNSPQNLNEHFVLDIPTSII